VLFSSLILSSCRVYGRERPVWSCGVVEWIGRPLISPTPAIGHTSVTTPREAWAVISAHDGERLAACRRCSQQP